MNEHFQVLSLKPYLDIVHRHRLAAMCTLAIGLGITACLVTMLPNVYRSQAVVLIEPQKVAQMYVTTPAASDPDNRVRILSAEVLSISQLEEIIRQLNLYPRRRAYGEPMDEVADYTRRRIAIDLGNSQGDNTRIHSFKISFEYAVPSIAQNVTTRLADMYIDQDLSDRTSQATAASQFLQDQATAARARLQQKTNEIEAYKTRNAGSLPQDLEYNLEQLAQLEQQLASINRQINDVSLKSGGASWESPEEKLKDMETRLATMQADYTDRYPDVKALRAEIASLKKSIAAGGGMGKTSAQAHRDAADAQVSARLETEATSVRASIAKVRERVAETPKHEQELSTLLRDNKILTTDYQQLLHKQLEAQTTARLEERQEGGRLRVLDPALLPLEPERPNRLAVAIIGAVLSLLAAIGLPFVLYLTDTSFKQPEELSRECGLSVLVTIPLVNESAEWSFNRWELVRAAGISCALLVVSAGAIWMYATTIF